LAFFVEEGAAMMAASTMVPVRDLHALVGEIGIEFGENLFAEGVVLKQMTKAAKGSSPRAQALALRSIPAKDRMAQEPSSPSLTAGSERLNQ
jgi:hypothetical protein